MNFFEISSEDLYFEQFFFRVKSVTGDLPDFDFLLFASLHILIMLASVANYFQSYTEATNVAY